MKYREQPEQENNGGINWSIGITGSVELGLGKRKKDELVVGMWVGPWENIDGIQINKSTRETRFRSMPMSAENVSFEVQINGKCAEMLGSS